MSQDLRSLYDHDHTRIVIATARNAAGSHPEDLQVMINMDSSSAAPTRNDALSCAFCDESHLGAQVLMKRTCLKKGGASFPGAPIERLGILCRMDSGVQPEKDSRPPIRGRSGMTPVPGKCAFYDQDDCFVGCADAQ
jgi:hypothetical protein